MTWHIFTTGGFQFPKGSSDPVGTKWWDVSWSQCSTPVGAKYGYTQLIHGHWGVWHQHSWDLFWPAWLHPLRVILVPDVVFEKTVSDSSVSHVGTDNPNDDHLGKFKKCLWGVLLEAVPNKDLKECKAWRITDFHRKISTLFVQRGSFTAF